VPVSQAKLKERAANVLQGRQSWPACKARINSRTCGCLVRKYDGTDHTNIHPGGLGQLKSSASATYLDGGAVGLTPQEAWSSQALHHPDGAPTAGSHLAPGPATWLH